MTAQNAINRCIEVIKTLSGGGFKLTKFISDSPKIFKELLLNGVSQEHSIVDIDLQNISIQRALGVLWDIENDLLKVKAVQKDITMPKSGLLSLVSSVFDPLGTHFSIIMAKKTRFFWLYEYDTYEQIEEKITITRCLKYSRDTWVSIKRDFKNI